MVEFLEEAHGSVVATVLETDEQIVEVVKRDDGTFDLIVHNFNHNTGLWDDLQASLTREQLASFGPLGDLRFEWIFKEHWSGETGNCRSGEFEARIQDCDGDFSVWTVREGGEVIANGEASCIDHFKIAQQSAEVAMIAASR